MTYKTKGVCASHIEFEVDDNKKVHNVRFIGGCGSLTVGYQKKVPAGRIKPAFFVSNFWFLSIVFYCNVL